MFYPRVLLGGQLKLHWNCYKKAKKNVNSSGHQETLQSSPDTIYQCPVACPGSKSQTIIKLDKQFEMCQVFQNTSHEQLTQPTSWTLCPTNSCIHAPVMLGFFLEEHDFMFPHSVTLGGPQGCANTSEILKSFSFLLFPPTLPKHYRW